MSSLWRSGGSSKRLVRRLPEHRLEAMRSGGPRRRRGPVWGLLALPRILRKDLISAPRAQRRSGEHRSRAQPRAAAGEHGAHGEEHTLTVASTERPYCW